MSKSRQSSSQKQYQESSGTTSTQQTLDPFIDAMRRQLAAAAEGAASAAPVPLNAGFGQAQGYFEAMQNLGLGASKILGGDSEAVAGAMNPYISNVIDASGAQFDKLRASTTKGINDAATAARAFGGSRHGVAQGVALGEIAGQEGTLRANLLKSGYDDVMARAMGAANLGFAGAGANASMAQYLQARADQNDPAMRRFNIFQQLIGSTPYTTNSQVSGTSKGWGQSQGKTTQYGLSPESVGGWLKLAALF